MKKFPLKSVFMIGSFTMVVGLGLAVLRVYQAVYGENAVRAPGEFADISITPGMTLQAIADLLQEKGVTNRSHDFILSAKILQLEHRVQAGEYALPYGESNASLLFRLIRVGENGTRVTIPEGFTAKEIASVLQKKIGLDSSQFLNLVRDSTLLLRYGIEAPSFEGFLFPDSYNLYRGIEPGLVLHRMVKRFFQVFDSTRLSRAAALGLSLTEAVALASIIEGEYKNYEEGCIISAVYHNRLKRNMLLQADPTVLYVVSETPRRLHRSDLLIESPYNTYLHPGLPPGPVCNPGKLALEFALNPAPVPYIFMVSQGDGTHAFSTTLEAHLQAKTKLDSMRQGYDAAQALTRDSSTQN